MSSSHSYACMFDNICENISRTFKFSSVGEIKYRDVNIIVMIISVFLKFTKSMKNKIR